jgi:hypothetical protein
VFQGGLILIHLVSPVSQADSVCIGDSAANQRSQSNGEFTPHVKAIKVISRMRGGSQSRLMLGDDGNLWIVKFKNNPQHLRILANELIATELARIIGLSVPVSGIIDVRQAIVDTHPPLYINHGPQHRELCQSGLQFGSKFAGGMVPRQVDEYMADEQLLNTHNLDQFAGILAFDKWTCNTDYRQVVYRRSGIERGYSAVFIDQGACFNMGEWNFPDAPLKGIFAQNSAYSTITGWESFEPWLSRIEQFDPQTLWEIVETVPREWYGGAVCELKGLVDKLISRRCRVRELIVQFKNSSKVPFPHWQQTHLSTLPLRIPPSRSPIGIAAIARQPPQQIA